MYAPHLPRSVRLLAGALLCLAHVLSPAHGAPAAKAAKPGAGKPSHVVLPPNAPPVITLWATNPAYAAPQKRLSSFIRALQMGNREKAVRLFSSKVTAEERRTFLEKKWLRGDASLEGNFAQMLFQKDLEIRAREKIKGDVLRCSVSPRKIAHLPRMRTKGKGLVGYMEVPMRREHGEWLVELHPGKGF